MIAAVAPGQGAQTPGMLTSWLELAGVESYLERLSPAAGIDLVAAGTTWTAEQIRPTEIAQPLITAATLVTAQLLMDQGVQFDLVTGHSVGEWSALALSGCLSPERVMQLVAVRGNAMGRACADAPTAMAAVLGGDADDVTAAITDAGATVANFNGAGQLVAAGPVAAIDRLIASGVTGARIRPLPVAGAFHTEAMRSAATELTSAAASLVADDPTNVLISNVDGAAVTSGSEAVRRAVGQVARPVRWDSCLEAIANHGPDFVVELAPAGSLASSLKRAIPNTQVVTIKSPTDVAELAAHARSAFVLPTV